MHDPDSTLWFTLDLDPETSGFLGLPRRLVIPESHAAPVLGRIRPSLTALGEAVDAAWAQDPDLRTDPALARFRRRWRSYADLERFLEVGNTTFAETTARRLLAEDPRDPPALLALALAAAVRGEWPEALRRVEAFREGAPDHPGGRLYRALALAGAGRREESLAELVFLGKSRWQSIARLWRYEIRNAPADDLGDRIRRGLGTRFPTSPPETGDPVPDAGLPFALAAFPENPEVLFLRSLDPRSTPSLTACETTLRRVLAADPDHEGAAALLGRVLRAQGRPLEARRHLEGLLIRLPEHPELLAELGETLETLGEPEAAAAAYRRSFSPPWDGVSARSLLAAGLGLVRVGETEILGPRIEEALGTLPAEPALHELRARILEGTEGPEAAERALRDGAKACGPRPGLLYSLGSLLRRMDRRHEAEGLMKALIQRHPESPWGYRGLGDLRLPEDIPAALAQYAEAARRDPVTPIPGVEYLRGLEALRAGDTSTAVARLERAVLHEPGNPRFWCDLGAAYFQAERVDEALRATRRALGLSPDQAGFWHNLAVYHREQFRRRPWKHPLGLWRAWRFERNSRRGDAHWRRHLWRPPAPAADEPPHDPAAGG